MGKHLRLFKEPEGFFNEYYPLPGGKKYDESELEHIFQCNYDSSTGDTGIYIILPQTITFSGGTLYEYSGWTDPSTGNWINEETKTPTHDYDGTYEFAGIFYDHDETDMERFIQTFGQEYTELITDNRSKDWNIEGVFYRNGNNIVNIEMSAYASWEDGWEGTTGRLDEGPGCDANETGGDPYELYWSHFSYNLPPRCDSEVDLGCGWWLEIGFSANIYLVYDDNHEVLVKFDDETVAKEEELVSVITFGPYFPTSEDNKYIEPWASATKYQAPSTITIKGRNNSDFDEDTADCRLVGLCRYIDYNPGITE